MDDPCHECLDTGFVVAPGEDDHGQPCPEMQMGEPTYRLDLNGNVVVSGAAWDAAMTHPTERNAS